MNSSDMLTLLRGVQYIIHTSGFDHAERYLQDRMSSGYTDSLIRDIPIDTLLILKIITVYDAELSSYGGYCSSDELHITEVIAKVISIPSDVSDPSGSLNLKIYGVEKRGTVDSDKIQNKKYSLPYRSLISYREFRVKDAALFVNWYWMSRVLKGILFGR